MSLNSGLDSNSALNSQNSQNSIISPKKKYLIALDLDGTLLRSDYFVSQENIKALQRAQSEGHIIMFCSGRDPKEIEMMNSHQPELKNLIDMNSIPLGASNGCVVMINGKLHSQIGISKRIILQTSRFLESMHYAYLVYTNQGIFRSGEWEDAENKFPLKNYPEYNNAKQLDPSKFFSVFESEVLCSEKYPDLCFQKVFVKTGPEMREEMLKNIRQFHENLSWEWEKSTLETSPSDISAQDDEDSVSLIATAPHSMLILPSNGNKEYALKTVANYFQIPMENTIAIGDSHNDIPMIAAAKIGICMGNGEECVKEIADFVTLSNNENGVAHAFEKFVFANENPKKEFI